MTYAAKNAIARSVAYTEIVTLEDHEAGALDIEYLVAECEGDVVGNDVHEFWGTDEDSYEWRVHVKIGD